MSQLDNVDFAQIAARKKEKLETGPKLKKILESHARAPKELKDIFSDVRSARAEARELAKKDKLKD